MKWTVFKLKFGAWLNNLPKLAMLFVVLFALELSTVVNADAQRRGGFGHSGFRYIGHPNRSFGEFRGRFIAHPYFFPRWGVYYGYLPFWTGSFLFGGLDYYLYDGIYYRNFNGNYAMVPAPIGHRVRSLPKGYEQFYMDSIPYYYYYGSFYMLKGKKYEVVPAPVGAMVEHIPYGYEKVVTKGETYYIGNGVQYKVVLQNDEIWYKVVKSEGDTPSNAPPQKKEQNTQPESTKS